MSSLSSFSSNFSRCCKGVVLFDSPKAKYVLTVTTPAGKMGFPKGSMGQGETPEESAARELQEETSVPATECLFVPDIWIGEPKWTHTNSKTNQNEQITPINQINQNNQNNREDRSSQIHPVRLSVQYAVAYVIDFEKWQHSVRAMDDTELDNVQWVLTEEISKTADELLLPTRKAVVQQAIDLIRAFPPEPFVDCDTWMKGLSIPKPFSHKECVRSSQKNSAKNNNPSKTQINRNRQQNDSETKFEHKDQGDGVSNNISPKSCQNDSKHLSTKVQYKEQYDILDDNLVRIKKKDRTNQRAEKQMETLSRGLSQYLRHKAVEAKLDMDSEGYVPLNQLLQLPKFNGYTVADVQQVVKDNNKQRFDMIERHDNFQYVKQQRKKKILTDEINETEAETSQSSQSNQSKQWFIRCRQGHSAEVGQLINDSKALVKLDKPLPKCIHGTTLAAWKIIQKEGLNRMKRKHIHFAIDVPVQTTKREENDSKTSQTSSSSRVISGARASSQVLIYVNMEKAMADGIVFYQSDNGVILSEGLDGTIAPKYFESHEFY